MVIADDFREISFLQFFVFYLDKKFHFGNFVASRDVEQGFSVLEYRCAADICQTELYIFSHALQFAFFAFFALEKMLLVRAMMMPTMTTKATLNSLPPIACLLKYTVDIIHFIGSAVQCLGEKIKDLRNRTETETTETLGR